MQLDDSSQKIHSVREQRPGILGRDSKGETADLERDKPKVPEHNKNEEEMEGFDPSLSLKNQLTQVNEQMGSLERKE